MHLSLISTRGQTGLDAPSVTVEVHLSAGLPAFQVVGLEIAAQERSVAGCVRPSSVLI